MFESTRGGISGPIDDLESCLNRLESALTEAADVVTSLRSALPHMEALVDVVRAMESAMSLAQQRTAPSEARQVEPVPPPAAPPANVYRDEPPVSTPAAQSEQVASPSAPQFLHLRVACKNGPLDLKAVDAAVGEQPGVIDVALLEYDGRHAVLQVWIANADPVAIGEALLEGLHRRLGGEDSAEVEIEVPQAA